MIETGRAPAAASTEPDRNPPLPDVPAPAPGLTAGLYRFVMLMAGAAGMAAVGWSIAAAWHYRLVLPEADMLVDFRRHLDLPFPQFLIAPANEHILLFPRLFYLADWYLGFADGGLLQLSIFALLAVETLLLAAGGSLPAGGGSRIAALWLPIVAAMLFWLCDWANLVFPMQLHMYLSLCFGVAALLVQTRLPASGRGVWTWALLCLGSLFSFGIGLGWVSALAVLLLVQPLAAPLRRRLLSLALLVLALTATVMLTQHATRSGEELWYAIARPLRLLSYVHQGITAYDFWLAWLLPPWLVQVAAFACYAMLLTDLALHWRRRRSLDSRRVFGFGLMLAVAATFLVAGVARLDFPGAEPYANRYMSIPPLFWIGAAIYLNACLPTGRRTLRRLAQAAVAVALVTLVLSSQQGFLGMARTWTQRSRQAEAAVANEALPLSVLQRLPVCATCDEDLRYLFGTIDFLKHQKAPLFSRPGLASKGRSIADLPRLRGTQCKVTLESTEVPGVRGPVLALGGIAHSQTSTLLAILVVDRAGIVRGVGWPVDSWRRRGDWIAYLDAAMPHAELKAEPLLRSGGVVGLCATP